MKHNLLKMTVLIICLLSLLVTVVVVAIDRNDTDLTHKGYHEERYVVEPGDTLYGIANEYAKDNVSIRQYVDALKDLNNIGADIKVGQVINIYVME